jgi:hypothetical protein
VASSLQPDVLFTHNDSGDSARFFAIDDRTCRTLTTYDLRGTTATDWEDIARGPGAVLWLGDIGDNAHDRPTISVHRVVEPRTSSGTVDLTATTFTFTYPDGPHDAETLLADPRDGRLYVITKSLTGADEALYAAPLPTASGRLTKLADVTIPLTTRLASLPDLAVQRAITGGDISPDGTRLVIRTYLDAFVATIPAGGMAHVFDHGPGTRVELPSDPQGEGICWSIDGTRLFTTSEGKGSAVHVVTP